VNFQLSLRQKEIATGLLVIAICFGSLLAVEALLRVQQWMSFGAERNVEAAKQYYIHAETGLRLPVPNSNHGKIVYNSLGFRSPEIPAEKPAQTIRLAFLGSSTTLDPFTLKLEDT
jgi:hypothetical protein